MEINLKIRFLKIYNSYSKIFDFIKLILAIHIQYFMIWEFT